MVTALSAAVVLLYRASIVAEGTIGKVEQPNDEGAARLSSDCSFSLLHSCRQFPNPLTESLKAHSSCHTPSSPYWLAVNDS